MIIITIMIIKIIVYNNMNNSHYTLPNSTDDMKRNLKKLKNIRIIRVKLHNFTLLPPDNQCLARVTF